MNTSDDEFYKDLKRMVWLFTLPVLCIIIVSVFSCAGAIALVVQSFR